MDWRGSCISIYLFLFIYILFYLFSYYFSGMWWQSNIFKLFLLSMSLILSRVDDCIPVTRYILQFAFYRLWLCKHRLQKLKSSFWLRVKLINTLLNGQRLAFIYYSLYLIVVFCLLATSHNIQNNNNNNCRIKSRMRFCFNVYNAKGNGMGAVCFYAVFLRQ